MPPFRVYLQDVCTDFTYTFVIILYTSTLLH